MEPILDTLLQERFAQDSLLALATVEDGRPWVRTVDAYYADGAFYVLTHAKSHKMLHIAQNPVVALSGEWFTCHGLGENLGYFGAPKNQAIAEQMRTVFAAWIDNGHNDFADVNTVILRITLTDGVLLKDGHWYTF